MNDERFIKLAIKEAKKSEQAGGAPIGAILVKNGKIISAGWSLVWPKKIPLRTAKQSVLEMLAKNFKPWI